MFGPSTTFGKDLMPCVAALLGVAQVSDVMAVEGSHTFKRPIYAGNAIITVEAPADHAVVATVRTASWPEAARGGNAPVEAVTVDAALPTHTRFVGLAAGKSDRPDLQSARRVVSGGRGVGSAENFKIIYDFADKLGAAVGASRAAVDAGYCPNEMQVGQTGKIIAPELYVAIGISGAIQHLTGIKDAGTIVAINKDARCADLRDRGHRAGRRPVQAAAGARGGALNRGAGTAQAASQRGAPKTGQLPHWRVSVQLVFVANDGLFFLGRRSRPLDRADASKKFFMTKSTPDALTVRRSGLKKVPRMGWLAMIS